MEKRISFEQYRGMDLLVFSVLTAVFECIATLATSKWFAAQPIAISLTLTMTLIVMHRWGAFSAIVAGVGGVVFCLFSSATIDQIIIYSVGNVFALVSLVYFRLYGKEAVKASVPKTLLFVSTSYISVALGRWLISLAFGSGFSEFVGFLTSDIASLLFASVILWSFRGIDGLIEDQKHYLLRINKEEDDTQPEG